MSVHRLQPLAALEGCQLWLVDLDAPALPNEFDGLPREELARADRFYFARDRARFLAGRRALREVLGARTGRAPGALALGYGPQGKPYLQDAPAPAFNLSHSGGIGLVALLDDGGDAQAAIGVDIETLRPLPDARELAVANFEPDECEALERLPEPERSKAFLIGWTRKEACLKALGSGFSGPARLATGLQLDAGVVAWDSSTASVRSFELQSHGAVASLARLHTPSMALA
jgi:4'-phosphopantetheinyl transferase